MATKVETQEMELIKEIEKITHQSLNSMKAKLGDQVSDFQVREFAIEKFEAFLNSPQTASAFIAPGGYGKTTIVAQLTEMFFMGEYPRYPDDIVCLIDGSILINLINLNQEIARMINIIDLEDRNSFSNYFRKNPEQFDLVVTDLAMPDMDGLEMSKKMLLIQPETPIIMCTGFGDEVTLNQVNEIGIRKLLYKPFIKKEFATAIRQILDHADPEQDLTNG